MNFVDREQELDRLEQLMARREGALAVVYGRRRIGKTRLLLEWSRRHGGLYAVADQSSAEIQRRYLADTVAAHPQMAGFGDVVYPDWRTLLTRIAQQAQAAKWRGPLILDELPNLVLAAPELPSTLQPFIDHEAREARLVVAVAGSSQRMIQGLVLRGDAPLYGRARELIDLPPLPVSHLPDAFGRLSASDWVQTWTAWGGVPRYWELAVDTAGRLAGQIDRLCLDPRGPLHREPDRLLQEEVPSALEVRPVLDAIGMGVHRVSEIAARVGRPATSLSRPLERLRGLGLAVRETPFGEPEQRTRRSLHCIQDPFFRLWFRVVAPHRGWLSTADRAGRLALLGRYWPALCAATWEDLCRQLTAKLSRRKQLGALGPWTPGQRWWRGNAPEWDIVAANLERTHLLLGEVKWSEQPLTRAALHAAARRLADRTSPDLPAKLSRLTAIRVLFVPAVAPGLRRKVGAVQIVTARDLLSR